MQVPLYFWLEIIALLIQYTTSSISPLIVLSLLKS